MKNGIFDQIKNATRMLIRAGISVHQHHPKIIGNQLVWEGFKDIAFVLKNQKYENMYNECLANNAYNIMLLDGSIIQVMYEFKNSNIISHRLAFYPNPNYDKYQDDPENFEERYFGNKLFTDLFDEIDESTTTLPIRFDYDIDVKKFIELDHSYSHMTLGNYKNCRIPVSSPLSPYKFIEFILRHFYFNKYKEAFGETDFACSIKMIKSLTAKEQKGIYLSLGI